MMEAFAVLRSPFVVLPEAHIDTDQIIPARFLRATSKEGLGQLFYDWRFAADGSAIEGHSLSDAAGAKILVAGPNFGCGSSREHAVWALHDFGFRAVLSPSIGDIFKSNALKNGLLPIEMSLCFFQELVDNTKLELCIDLSAETVMSSAGRSVSFKAEAFARYCLLRGTDQLSYLLSLAPKVLAFETFWDVMG